MQSLGPDGTDHTLSANGFTFDDAGGSERVYMQGQTDLFVAVKGLRSDGYEFAHKAHARGAVALVLEAAVGAPRPAALEVDRAVGVVVDAAGNIYVADTGNNRIRKVTPQGEVITIAGDGNAGYADGPAAQARFNGPIGVAVDTQGNIYVADTDNHAIQKFDKEGKFLARWGGEAGTQEGMFYYPRGLATSPEGDVYVADSGNNRVQKFDGEGNLVHAWGKFGFAWRGADMGKFDVPWGVTTDHEGNLYVSDTSNARIQKFKADGTPLLKWGRDGSFDGAFFYPRGLAVDFAGNVFVADEGNHRVQKFDARGSFLTKWGKEGSAPGQFKAPWGIACDALGNVYVVDSGNHRIQKFDGNGTFLCAWSNRGITEGQLNYAAGLAVDGELHPVQRAFVDAGAIQCGFCTPGLVVAAVDLLARVPEPSEDQIREALSGNLCRCTGYAKIVDAVRVAAGEAGAPPAGVVI